MTTMKTKLLLLLAATRARFAKAQLLSRFQRALLISFAAPSF